MGTIVFILKDHKTVKMAGRQLLCNSLLHIAKRRVVPAVISRGMSSEMSAVEQNTMNQSHLLASLQQARANGVDVSSEAGLSAIIADMTAAREGEQNPELAEAVNAAIAKRVLEYNHGEDHADTLEYWKWGGILTFPIVLLLSLRGYWKETAHLEHLAEHGPPEFVPYAHLRIRTKEFPWGDGVKTLFHDPLTNALPDGYEAVDEE